MGGYAADVWSAFGVTLVLMAGLFVQSGLAARRRSGELEELRATVRPQRPGSTRRPLRARKEADLGGTVAVAAVPAAPLADEPR